VGEEGAAAEERSARALAMRDGTRNENATRWWGAIEMDVNEDSVAPWKVDGMPVGDCAEESVEGGGGGADFECGMNEVTTATGCAISRKSARILWESPRTFTLLVVRLEEDRCFAVASASAKRDMVLTVTRPATRVQCIT
jgi:hypothetical protein